MMKNVTKTNNKTALLAILAVFAMVAAGAAVVVASDVDAAVATFGDDVDQTNMDTSTTGAQKIYQSKNSVMTVTKGTEDGSSAAKAITFTFAGYADWVAADTQVQKQPTLTANDWSYTDLGIGDGKKAYAYLVFDTELTGAVEAALTIIYGEDSEHPLNVNVDADDHYLIMMFSNDATAEYGHNVFNVKVDYNDATADKYFKFDFTGVTIRDQVKAEIITTTTASALADGKTYYLPASVSLPEAGTGAASNFYMEKGASLKAADTDPKIYTGAVLTTATAYVLIQNDASLAVTVTASGKTYTQGDGYISVNAAASYGTVTAASSLTLAASTMLFKNGAVINQDIKLAGSLVVDASKTLTIAEGYTIGQVPGGVQGIDVANSGTLYVFGVLNADAAASTKTGNVFIGPRGLMTPTGYTAAKVINTLEGGADPIISGEPTSDSINNAILGGNLTIPADTTFTVKGSLGLNGYALIVEGTLVVDPNAIVYAAGVDKNEGAGALVEGIYLGIDGGISGNGAIAIATPIDVYNEDRPTDFVTVNGAFPGFVSVERAVNGGVATYYLAVGGTARLMSGVVAGTITLNGVTIVSDMTVPAGVTLGLGTNVTLQSGNTLAINGAISGDGEAGEEFVIIENNSTVTINGAVLDDAAFKADTKVLDNKGATVDHSTDTQPYVKITESASGIVSGLEITVAKVTVPGLTASSTYTYQRMFLSGDVIDKPTGNVAAEAVSINIANTSYAWSGATVYTAYVSALDELNFATGVSMTGVSPGQALVMEGTMVSKAVAGGNLTILGARYDVTVTGQAPTYYYGTLADTMEYIDIADNKTVYATVSAINDDLIIEKGQTLSLATGVAIYSEVAVAGTITGSGITSVTGMLQVASDATCPKPASYDVKTTLADGSTLYSGIAKAIEYAQPGSVITVGEATTAANVTVPAGVTVEVGTSWALSKNLTISETASVVLKNGATLSLNGGATNTLVVDGTLDCTKGTFSSTITAPNTSFEGVAMFASPITNYTGASFTDSTGYFVITNVSDAVLAAALTADVKTVTVKGNLSQNETVVSDGVDIIIAENSIVSLGIVMLDAATLTINGTLSADIMAEDDDADVEIEIAGIKGLVVKDIKTTSGSGDVSYNVNVEVIDSGNVESGTLAFMAGVVTVNETMDIKADLYVGSEAELKVTGNFNLTISGTDVATIAGKLTVTGNGRVAFTSAKSTIAGELFIGKNTSGQKGAVTADSMLVLGTVNAADGDFTYNSEGKLIIGIEPCYVGAAPTFVGNIALTGAKAFLVYSGSDVSKMTVDAVGDTDKAKFSVMEINGVPYMIVYGSATHPGKINDVIAYPDYAIDGLNPTQLNALKTKAGWGIAALDDPAPGAELEYDADVAVQQVAVVASWDTGMSLYVDNVRVTESPIALDVGVHTVMVKVNPGYKYVDGTTPSITFNGKAVTGLLAFEVTSDMAGNFPVLSATADIVIDEQPIPEQKEKDDTMMIILLAILVIMIAILVVVVILRMMRS